MASEDTLLGNDLKFQIGTTDSPPVFSDFCAVVDTGSIGEEKPLVDVTSLCDAARTYRGGLADGVTIPLKCNFIKGDTATRDMYQAYKANEVRTFRLRLDTSGPAEYFEFHCIITAWNIATPVGDKASITFSLKVSGEILWHYT